MVSFNLLQSASLLALFSTLVSAAPAKSGCSGFHVTAPHSYFQITAGQCYQVSYDFGGTKPSNPSWVSVDLYDYKTNKLVSSPVKKISADGISTPWFNLDTKKKTGDFYFLVTYGDNCKPIKTPYFHISYNKNSSPSKCI